MNKTIVSFLMIVVLLFAGCVAEGDALEASQSAELPQGLEASQNPESSENAVASGEQPDTAYLPAYPGAPVFQDMESFLADVEGNFEYWNLTEFYLPKTLPEGYRLIDILAAPESVLIYMYESDAGDYLSFRWNIGAPATIEWRDGYLNRGEESSEIIVADGVEYLFLRYPGGGSNTEWIKDGKNFSKSATPADAASPLTDAELLAFADYEVVEVGKPIDAPTSTLPTGSLEASQNPESSENAETSNVQPNGRISIKQKPSHLFCQGVA